MSKTQIPRAVQIEVQRRDGWRCRYCGDLKGPFEYDHVYPEALGGKTNVENVVVSCQRCNRMKSADVGMWPFPAGYFDELEKCGNVYIGRNRYEYCLFVAGKELDRIIYDCSHLALSPYFYGDANRILDRLNYIKKVISKAIILYKIKSIFSFLFKREFTSDVRTLLSPLSTVHSDVNRMIGFYIDGFYEEFTSGNYVVVSDLNALNSSLKSLEMVNGLLLDAQYITERRLSDERNAARK